MPFIKAKYNGHQIIFSLLNSTPEIEKDLPSHNPHEMPSTA